MRSARPLAVLAIVLLAMTGMSDGAPITYTTALSGPAEDPPNASPGTGTAIVDIDVAAHTLRVRADFTGLLGMTTIAHIHAPTAVPFAGTAGVATMTPTFTGFPAGVTSGSYDVTFDTSLTSTFNAPYVTANGGTAAGAEAGLAADLAAGRAYFNIHSSMFGGGEIRGFFPEPTTLAGLLLAGAVFSRRRGG